MFFFSIVIPTYNRAGFIEKTIRSVQNQTFSSFELIVVDDGSIDDTEKIIQNFKEDKRIKYFYQVNAERGAARNRGFQESSGKYVVFFDSDDSMHVDHLQVLYNHIVKQSFPDFIATKYRFERGGYYTEHVVLRNYKQQYYDYHIFLDGNPLACNFAVRKEVEKLKPFIEDRRYAIMEDWLYLLDNLLDKKIYLIDEVTITMHDHDTRSMRISNEDIINKRFLAQNWIQNNLSLSEKDKRRSLAMSYYFCALHSYGDNNKQKAIKYAVKSLLQGYKSINILSILIRSIVGFQTIQKIKNAVR